MKTLKKHFTFPAGFCILLVLFFSCNKNKENNDLPKLTTSAVTYIGDKLATGSGTVITMGTSDIYVVGICWSTSHAPVWNGQNYSMGKKTIGDFQCLIDRKSTRLNSSHANIS